VGPDRYDNPVVSPDGQWLLFTQSCAEDHAGNSARLMRMPVNWPRNACPLGKVFVQMCCPSQCLRAVRSCQRPTNPLLIGPLSGRGHNLAKADVAWNDYGWSLSADGKKISLLSDSDPSQIQIFDTDGGKKSAIVLKGWLVQSTSWSPDNQHLYIPGGFGSGFTVASVGLDGKAKSFFDVPLSQGWPTDLQPSPNGRYLGYVLRLFEANVVMLEKH
jgi:Tol biopolymer transport system component